MTFKGNTDWVSNFLVSWAMRIYKVIYKVHVLCNFYIINDRGQFFYSLVNPFYNIFRTPYSLIYSLILTTNLSCCNLKKSIYLSMKSKWIDIKWWNHLTSLSLVLTLVWKNALLYCSAFNNLMQTNNNVLFYFFWFIILILFLASPFKQHPWSVRHKRWWVEWSQLLPRQVSGGGTETARVHVRGGKENVGKGPTEERQP